MVAVTLFFVLVFLPCWASEALLCLVISFFLYLCFRFMPPNTSGLCSFGFAFSTFFIPGPFRASTTWAQFLLLSFGNLVHLFTISTHALHTSPCLNSCSLKQFPNAPSYFLLLVNLELKNNNTEVFIPQNNLIPTCSIWPCRCSSRKLTCRSLVCGKLP